MSNFNEKTTANEVFADPVAYLAGFGIEAELIGEDTQPLPAAA